MAKSGAQARNHGRELGAHLAPVPPLKPTDPTLRLEKAPPPPPTTTGRARMRLPLGTALGPYELTGALGAGGMGEVYRARDPRLHRDVAIKVLPPAFAEDDERLRRFEQEARAAGLLNHPNIVAIYDFGTHDGGALCGLGAAGRRDPAPSNRRPRAVAPEGGRHRHPAHARPGGGAPSRDRPPGPEARQHHPHPRRPGEDPRLRPRQADPPRPGRAGGEPLGHLRHRHRAGRGLGHGRVHVAGAGPREAGRLPLRPLLLRRHPLRNAVGTPRVQGRHPRRHDERDLARGSARDHGHGPRHSARAGADRPALFGEEPGGAVPIGARRRVRFGVDHGDFGVEFLGHAGDGAAARGAAGRARVGGGGGCFGRAGRDVLAGLGGGRRPARDGSYVQADHVRAGQRA